MHLLRRALTVAATAAAVVVLGGTGAHAAPADLNATDRTFLAAAHQSNLAEIQAGTLAQQKATEQVTKELGAKWIADHTKLDASLRAVATKLGVTLPTAPNAEQRAAAARLTATSGAAFDKLWFELQMVGHMKSMANGEREVAGGNEAEVVALAKAAGPVIMEHGTLLDENAAEVGAAPSAVDAGTGGQAAQERRSVLLASVVAAAGLLLVTVSARTVRRRRVAPAGRER